MVARFLYAVFVSHFCFCSESFCLGLLLRLGVLDAIVVSYSWSHPVTYQDKGLATVEIARAFPVIVWSRALPQEQENLTQGFGAFEISLFLFQADNGGVMVTVRPIRSFVLMETP